MFVCQAYLNDLSYGSSTKYKMYYTNINTFFEDSKKFITSIAKIIHHRKQSLLYSVCFRLMPLYPTCA